MKWWGWGNTEIKWQLAHELRALLCERVGVAIREAHSPTAQPHLPPAQPLAPPGLFEADGPARLAHCAGRSTPDLLRLRWDRVKTAPDAVAYPRSIDEVKALLRWAADEKVAVVPFGGGTSVVGGVAPLRGEQHAVVTMDLRRLNRFLELDEVSGLARVECGLLGPDLEAELARRGFSLGHFPQSFEYSTVGGWIAARSAGQNSTLHGKIEDLVSAVKLSSPCGEIANRELPASAAGPALRELLVGSEGSLGVLTEASLRVHRLPSTTRYASFFLRSYAEGVDVVRELMQNGPRPSVLRLSDETETALHLILGGANASRAVRLARRLGKSPWLDGAHLLVGFEGSAATVESNLRHTRYLARRSVDGGVFFVGGAPGRRWEAERFELPYLRDTLLDMGLVVDTFETAATWSRLPDLYSAMLAALQELGVPLVLTHLSHAYRDGASLYFTWISDGPDPDQALEMWERIKARSAQVILDFGATLSHHHGVGTDHRPYLATELGGGQLELLRAAKAHCDPAGIMNPEKLLPAARHGT